MHIKNKTDSNTYMQTYTHINTHTHIYKHTQTICVYVTIVSEKGAVREVQKELDEGKRKWKLM